MTKRRSAARCYPLPGTNDNTPAYSRWSGPGLIYALCGPLAASAGRFAVREYRDSRKGIKRRVGPANGLYGGFAFLDVFRPAGHGRKKCRLLAVERRTSGGKLAGSIGTWPPTLDGLEGIKKPAPDCSKGGRWWYSRFFCRLPDDHQGKD